MHNSYRNNTGVLKVITSNIKFLKGFVGKFGKTNIWKASFLLGVTCLDKGFDLTWFAAIYLSIYDKLHITRTPQQVLQNLSCIIKIQVTFPVLGIDFFIIRATFAIGKNRSCGEYNIN